MSQESTQLGYPFAPVPRRALAALTAGRLSPKRFALIAYLYESATWERLAKRQPTPTRTLAQIAEGVDHKGSLDALSKRLRRLRAVPERWFDYTVANGRYRFTLYPAEPQNASEPCPTPNAETGPTSTSSEQLATPDASSSKADRLSDQPTASVETARPSTDTDCPSTTNGTRPDSNAKTTSASGADVRDRQTFQSEPNPSLTTGYGKGASEELIPWLPEVLEAHRARGRRRVGDLMFPETAGLAGEQAVLADCDAFLAVGGYWVLAA